MFHVFLSVIVDENNKKEKIFQILILCCLGLPKEKMGWRNTPCQIFTLVSIIWGSKFTHKTNYWDVRFFGPMVFWLIFKIWSVSCIDCVE